MTWIIFAFFSAMFAALVAVFGKIGIKGYNPCHDRQIDRDGGVFGDCLTFARETFRNREFGAVLFSFFVCAPDSQTRPFPSLRFFSMG